MIGFMEGFSLDELGRLYLCDDDGNPFSGPYDTLEEARAALAAIEDDGDGKQH